ncbi:MAG: hypothetical protein QM664_10865 [Flavihumibacter sp.]
MKFIAVVDNKSQAGKIATALKAMGCSIDQVLKLTGVINGDSGSRRLEELKIDGVKSVEADNIKRAKR